MTTETSNRLIRRSEVQRRLGGISPATIWRWVAAGKLPKPIKLSARLDAWPESEIDALADALIASRNAA